VSASSFLEDQWSWYLPAMNTRQDLLALAHGTLDALVQRRPDTLSLAACRYTENGQDVALDAGLWSSVTGVSSRWVIADPESQQALVFAALREADSPCLAAFRLRASTSTDRVTELEALVSRKGQSSAFAPERWTQLNPLYDQTVPAAERGDRAALQDAADRYFDGIETDSSTRIPFHASCQRFENGVQTTGNPEFLGGMGCREQFDQKLFAYIESVRARRYPVFDLERGLVGACVFLDVPGTVTHFELRGRRHELPARIRSPRSVLLFEVFKVIAGSIHQIEAFMVNLPYLTRSGWEAPVEQSR
jgi:hypothetical protein